MSKAKILFLFFWKYFRGSGELLFLYFFDLDEHGIQGHVEGFFEGFGTLFDEQFMLGYGHPDLCYFILYLVHDIIKFEKDIHVHDLIMVVLELTDLFVDMFDEFRISFKMHTVNINSHGSIFIGF